MAEAVHEADYFNVVVMPVEGGLFQLSATRRDGAVRMVSAASTEAELRVAFASVGTEPVRVEELLRGNRRVAGARDGGKLFFATGELVTMGLVVAA